MKRYNQLPVNNQCKESSVSIHHRACATGLAGCGARQRPLGLGAELLPPTGNAGPGQLWRKDPHPRPTYASAASNVHFTRRHAHVLCFAVQTMTPRSRPRVPMGPRGEGEWNAFLAYSRSCQFSLLFLIILWRSETVESNCLEV